MSANMIKTAAVMSLLACGMAGTARVATSLSGDDWPDERRPTDRPLPKRRLRVVVQAEPRDPIPPGTMTRQQRRAAERAASKRLPKETDHAAQ